MGPSRRTLITPRGRTPRRWRRLTSTGTANSTWRSSTARTAPFLLACSEKGTEVFQSQVVYQVPGAQSLVAGDFNNDHKLDLVVSAPFHASGQWRWYLSSSHRLHAVEPGSVSNGSSRFQSRRQFGSISGRQSISRQRRWNVCAACAICSPNSNSGDTAGAVATDLNGDGKPDIVATNGSEVAVLLGNGDGNSQTIADYAAAPYSSDVLVADFNGDGRLDLAVAESGCLQFSCSTSPARQA